MAGRHRPRQPPADREQSVDGAKRAANTARRNPQLIAVAGGLAVVLALGAFWLAKRTAGGGAILRWSAITAFGGDAVTITGADTITAGDDTIAALSGKDHRLLGKRVLTAGGDEIGSVEDVEFDADTGQITGLHLTDQHVAGVRLRGVGSYGTLRIVRFDRIVAVRPPSWRPEPGPRRRRHGTAPRPRRVRLGAG